MDNIVGTSGNDTVNGVIETAGTISLNLTDVIDLGAGTDTVKVNYANTAATFDATKIPTLTGVEIVTISGTNGASTMNGGIAPSLTTLNWNTPLTASVMTVSAAPATLLNYGMDAITVDDSDLVVTYATGALTGSSDAATVTVGGLKSVTNDAANSSDITLQGAASGSGFETVNMVVGSESRLGALVVADSANSTMSTLNISGAGALKIFGTLDFKSTSGTINASSNTGGVTLTVGTEAITMTGGSGNDTLTFVAAGDLDANDSITLGGGTDKIVLADTSISSTTTALNAAITATGAEIVGYSAAATVDMAYQAATKVAMSSTTDVKLTVNKLSSTDTVIIDTGTHAGADLDVLGSLGYTTLNLELNGTAAASVNMDIVTATSQSAVNIVSNGTVVGTSNVIDNLALSAVTTVTVTGAQGLTITEALANTAVVVNGSAMTGKLSVIGGTAASSLVGGSAVDSITGGVAGDTLEGGAGADVIKTGANANGTGDQVSGGLGADAVTVEYAVAAAATTLAYHATAAESFSAATATTTTSMDTLTLNHPNDTCTVTITFTTGVTSAQSGALTVTSTAPTIGTTTVAANGFVVYSADAAAVSPVFYVYQDTDGDGVLEQGEFAIKIVGSPDASDTEAFSVSSGKLVHLVTGSAD